MKRVVGVVLWLALPARRDAVARHQLRLVDGRRDVRRDHDHPLRRRLRPWTTNGDLSVTETLTVDFPGHGKHGIFRFFDRADPSAPHARREPARHLGHDGRAARAVRALARGTAGTATSRSARRPDSRSAGEHTYVDQLPHRRRARAGHRRGRRPQFYWNLIPGGWQQRDRQGRPHRAPPRPAPSRVQCAVGAGATAGCTAEGAGTDASPSTTGPLAPDTPVTVKAGLDMPTPPAGHHAAVDRAAATRSSAPASAGSLRAPARSRPPARSGSCSTTGAARAEARRTRCMYAPPDGIGPAQAKYIFTETRRQRRPSSPRSCRPPRRAPSTSTA